MIPSFTGPIARGRVVVIVRSALADAVARRRLFQLAGPRWMTCEVRGMLGYRHQPVKCS